MKGNYYKTITKYLVNTFLHFILRWYFPHEIHIKTRKIILHIIYNMDLNFTRTKTSPQEFISNKVKFFLWNSYILQMSIPTMLCSIKKIPSPFDNVLNSRFLSVIHYFDYFDILQRTSTFIAWQMVDNNIMFIVFLFAEVVKLSLLRGCVSLVIIPAFLCPVSHPVYLFSSWQSLELNKS